MTRTYRPSADLIRLLDDLEVRGRHDLAAEVRELSEHRTKATHQHRVRNKAQRGIEQADSGVDQAWRDYADEFIEQYLLEHEYMHTDDLWAAGLEAPPKGSERALGARFQAAARNGLMAPTSSFRKSARSNNSPKVVWRSLRFHDQTQLL